VDHHPLATIEEYINKTNMSEKTGEIINELCVAYGMELETVQNYIANSIDLDGVRSDIVKKALAADVTAEISHAQMLGQRIKTLGGRVPGSLSNDRNQKYLQPPEDSTDVISVIKGVIKAEEGAIRQYNKIIKLCEGTDYVTQDLVIEILGSEEEHRREFIGFLKEYEKAGR
jgi:bacterioferritin